MGKRIHAFRGICSRAPRFLLLCLVALADGCNGKPLVHSIVPDALSTNVLVIVAQLPSSSSASELGCASSGTAHSYEIERHFAVEWGTSAGSEQESLIQSIRNSITQAVRSCGARLEGHSELTGDGIQIFGYSYGWSKNAEVVRLYCAPSGSNRLDMVIFCYEHLK